MVVAVGVTATVVPVKLPGFHVYVEAPEPVKVAVSLEQITLGLELADTIGVVPTVKLTVPVFTQPDAFKLV